MSLSQIIILLVLLTIVIVLFVIARKMFRDASPTPPPITTPTPVVSPTTTARTVASISCQSRNGEFGKRVWGFTKGLFALSLLLALIAGIIYGGIWAKKKIDQVRSSNPSSKVSRRGGNMVEIEPGRYTIVPIKRGSTNLHYAPPRLTVVEYLDSNKRPLPIRQNGRVKYSIITGPGVDDDISIESDNFRYLRFSSAKNSGGNYTFSFEEN
jgi:uncharacterized protein YneF (UPF0154 family)